MEWTLHFFYAYSFKSNFPSESRGNFWSLFPLFSLFPFLSPVPSFPTKPCSPASFFWLGMLWFFFCGQGLFCKICSGTFRVLRMHRVLVFWACWRWVESNAPPPLWSGEHESSFISQMSIYLLNLWTISIKIEFDNTSGPRKLTN